MFATFKLLAVYLTFGSVAGLIGIPYTLIVGDITRLYWAAMWIVRTGTRAAGITILVEGEGNIPAGRSCIFMCNHVSNLDPPVLIQSIPGRCSVLLKKEILSIPILGTAMRMAKFVPVERGGKRDAAQNSVKAAADALNSGLHMIVFPEGTRSLDGRLSTFKKGPFFLAQGTGAPIIPVAISGTENMMSKGSAKITPGLATLRMLAPIEPGDYTTREDLLRAVRAAIAAALPESMQPQPTPER